MSDVILNEQSLYDIGDAIREKLEVSTEYKPSEMPAAIRSISGGGTLPYYTGSYDITPKLTTQTMGTNQKSMSGDVTIRPISFHEVSNPEGGYTLTIGDI